MRRREVEKEFAGQVHFERRAFLLLPGEGQRPVYDDYVISHRIAAAQRAPTLGFTLPPRGHPYPRSSVPPQLLAQHVSQRFAQRMEALEDALFRAVFTELADVADPAVLRRCAAQAGVPEAEVDVALADAAGRARVFADHEEAMAQGIHGIPALLFAGVHPITGAVETAVYRRAIQHALHAAEHGNPERPPLFGR